MSEEEIIKKLENIKVSGDKGELYNFEAGIILNLITKQQEEINNSVSKEDLKKFFGERLLKYNDADDGKYDKPYLTRGELELVDRYGECKEIAEILLKEKIEFPKECISKDKIRKLKEKYENKCAVLGRNSNNNQWYEMGKIFGKADLCDELLEE